MSDYTAININFDPNVERMEGHTAHGSMYFDVPFISHIIGNLYLGGCEDGLFLPSNIKNIFSMYPWERYRIHHEMNISVTVQMYDAQIEPDITQLDAIAAMIDNALDSGPTLVHCQAGLNRSSLVAAHTLITKRGWLPKEAIALLRAQRCEAVLCNKTFERFLLSLTPSDVAS
jgi:protein-tyrosine phosphatase